MQHVIEMPGSILPGVPSITAFLSANTPAKTFLNNYSDNAMKTIAYIMSTYHIGTHNSDIRDVLKSYIIARYYGWEPKEEDLEEIISNTPYFDIHIDDAIYEVLTMPKRRNNHLKQRTYENIRKYPRP